MVSASPPSTAFNHLKQLPIEAYCLPYYKTALFEYLFDPHEFPVFSSE